MVNIPFWLRLRCSMPFRTSDLIPHSGFIIRNFPVPFEPFRDHLYLLSFLTSSCPCAFVAKVFFLKSASDSLSFIFILFSFAISPFSAVNKLFASNAHAFFHPFSIFLQKCLFFSLFLNFSFTCIPIYRDFFFFSSFFYVFFDTCAFERAKSLS